MKPWFPTMSLHIHVHYHPGSSSYCMGMTAARHHSAQQNQFHPSPHTVCTLINLYLTTIYFQYSVSTVRSIAVLLAPIVSNREQIPDILHRNCSQPLV